MESKDIDQTARSDRLVMVFAIYIGVSALFMLRIMLCYVRLITLLT